MEQKFYYFNYKKEHIIIQLAIICSNNLIESIYNSCESKINNITMLQKFKLQNRLRNLFKNRRKL